LKLHVLFVALFAFSSCTAIPPEAQRESLTSRTGLSLTYTPPAGWGGPSRQTPRTYDAWSFSRDSSHIVIRVDRASKDSAAKLHRWLDASDADVTASLRQQWENPRAETIDYIRVDGFTMRIRAAHHVAGEQAWGNALVGQSELTLELDTDTTEEFSDHLPTFMQFVRSVRIESQVGATLGPNHALQPTAGRSTKKVES
jgi:hypothetical protein